jgi:hypothetical protein
MYLLALLACSDPAPTEPAATDTDDLVADSDVQPACTEGLKRGECLPDFTVLGPTGEDVTLSAYYGDVVLVSSGAMW